MLILIRRNKITLLNSSHTKVEIFDTGFGLKLSCGNHSRLDRPTISRCLNLLKKWIRNVQRKQLTKFFFASTRFRIVFTWKHTGVFIWKRICFFCVLDYCSQSKMQSHVLTHPHATTFWKRCVLRRSLL